MMMTTVMIRQQQYNNSLVIRFWSTMHN